MNVFTKQIAQVIHSHRLSQLLISPKYACTSVSKGLAQMISHTETGQHIDLIDNIETEATTHKLDGLDKNRLGNKCYT